MAIENSEKRRSNGFLSGCLWTIVVIIGLFFALTFSGSQTRKNTKDIVSITCPSSRIIIDMTDLNNVLMSVDSNGNHYSFDHVVTKSYNNNNNWLFKADNDQVKADIAFKTQRASSLIYGQVEGLISCTSREGRIINQVK